MAKNVFISTGKKSVMHTLWVETIVQRPNPSENEPNRVPILPAMIHYNYIKNLSMDETTADKEAQEYAKEHGADYLGVLDSPVSKRAEFFEAFGMHFTQRRKHGKSFFIATSPSSEFWDEWRKNKEDMKKAGFRVSKLEQMYRHGRRLSESIGVWYVFYNPDDVEE